MTTCSVDATFTSDRRAQRAVQALLEEHFVARDIRVGRHTRSGERPVEPPQEVEYEPSMVPGAQLGAPLGLLAGVVAATLTVGGLSTPEMAADFLQIVVLAVLGGTILGALAGLGFWRVRVHSSSRVQDDEDVHVSVSTYPARVDEARACLRGTGGIGILVTDLPENEAAVGAA